MYKEADLKDIANKVKDFFTFSVDDFTPSEEPTQSVQTQNELAQPVQTQNEPAVNIPSEETKSERLVDEIGDHYTSYEVDPIYGEVEIIQYKPKTPFPRLGELGVDNSLVVLQYLQSMGYKNCIWFLDEAHNFFSHHDKCGVDPCEENSSKQFSIEEVIEHAHAHSGGGEYICDESYFDNLTRLEQRLDNIENNKWYKPPEKEINDLKKRINEGRKGLKVEKWSPYSPPSPIFALSHTRCICHLLCLDPLDVDDIPDDAPGIPILSDQEIKQEFKQRIWDNIMALPEPGIEVHSYTLPPASEGLFEEYSKQQRNIDEYASVEDRKKFATENWKEDIVPIRIKENMYIKYPIGIIQPVFKDLLGFQIKNNNKLASVYIVDMNHRVYVPNENIEYLKLIDTEDYSMLDRGDFVYVDDMIGIIFNVTSDDNVECYLPELDTISSIDDFKKMKIMR